MSSSATHTPPAAGRWVPPYTEGMAPRGRIPSEVDVVVIGAGFAGASVAAALTRACVTRGCVLERELLPVECDTGGISEGDRLVIGDGEVRNQTTGAIMMAAELPGMMREIVAAGGLVPYFRRHRDFVV